VLAQNTIKVGVLHSLSGTMAISETVLKGRHADGDREINAKGGVLGKKLEPVVVDPASNWPLFAEKARQLIRRTRWRCFGCWTSVSRKSVLPVFEELNGLLFYPVQYEGEELSKNVFYTGAAPNQQAIPAVEYLMSKEGGGAKRWVLLGTDYVYPRTTNKILRAFLKSKGVADKDIDEKYTPFGHSDYQTIVADIKKFAAGGKTAVVSTINGDSNVPFYKELGNQGSRRPTCPWSRSRSGKRSCAASTRTRWSATSRRGNYFMTVKNPVERVVQEAMGRVREGEEAARRRQAAHQRSDGSGVRRNPHVEAGGREGQVDRHRQGGRGDGRSDLQGARRLRRSRWTRRTTICGSPCSSAKCRRTASSTSSGRRRDRSARNRGASTSRATRRRRTSRQEMIAWGSW
jgi:urea transport system substrate-binding protein